MKRLIYFSHTLIRPDGATDPFLMVEQDWLKEHFDHVDLVGENGTAVLDDPEKLQLSSSKTAGLKALGMLPFRPELWQEMGRMLKDGKFTPGNLKRLLFFTWRGIRMALHARPLLNSQDDITLYSFWMSFDGYAAALCHEKQPTLRMVMRGHAFDVDVERTALNPYLMKRKMSHEANGIYLISETAQKQLMHYMEGHADPQKVHILAMGSAGKTPVSPFPAPRFSDGVLRVVSCSSVLPIKQLDLLVEALSQWDGMPLSWTHIGGGPDLKALQTLADEKLSRKENVACSFTGAMAASDVNAMYEKQPFDVFVNTSRREGVPVSIMEAMRCGIPAIAPRVGGIPELVVQNAGYLYEPSDGVAGILQMLKVLCAQSREQSDQMRLNASRHWEKNYCSHSLLPRLFHSSEHEE